MNRVTIILLVLLIISCENEEGPGGKATIKGTVMTRFYNDDYSLMIDEVPAPEEEVFIIYGDDPFLGDQVETNFDGYFEFPYLRMGHYTVYIYSDDSLSNYNDKKEVTREVEISKTGETIDLGTIYKLEKLDFDDGNASISGRVFVINYRNSSQWPHLVVKDTALAQEQEIYLTYGEHQFYDERIRTQHDGTFMFRDLIKGRYTVFLYSEDVTGATQDSVIYREVEILDKHQAVVLDDIYIKQL